MLNGEIQVQPDWIEQKWELRLSIVAPRVSRSLQLYPSNCIQQVLEKLAVAVLLRRFHAVTETPQFIKIFTAFDTGSYPEPDPPNPLLVPVQS
jgi:hypothetical protein